MATVYYREDGWVKSTLGPAISGAQIYVCTQPANQTLPPTPLANIFSDPNGLVPITQPVYSDGFGHYDFYAAPGLYTIMVAFNGSIQRVYPDQSIGNVGSTGSGSSILFETNGTPDFNQLIRNLVQGAGITIVTDNSGNTTVTSTGLPGITVDPTPPTPGQVLTATSPTEADWETPSSGGASVVFTYTEELAGVDSPLQTYSVLLSGIYHISYSLEVLQADASGQMTSTTTWDSTGSDPDSFPSGPLAMAGPPSNLSVVDISVFAAAGTSITFQNIFTTPPTGVPRYRAVFVVEKVT